MSGPPRSWVRIRYYRYIVDKIKSLDQGSELENGVGKLEVIEVMYLIGGFGPWVINSVWSGVGSGSWDGIGKMGK